MLDGDSSPPCKGAQQPPPLLAHVYCGQKAGWIKIPLGTDVGLGPGDVLDADPAPSTFGPCLLWPNGPPSQLMLSLCSVMLSQMLETTVHSVVFKNITVPYKL